jgi:hypothetical protein
MTFRITTRGVILSVICQTQTQTQTHLNGLPRHWQVKRMPARLLAPCLCLVSGGCGMLSCVCVIVDLVIWCIIFCIGFFFCEMLD